jgi:putative alpha-1,2-mannosidase
MFWDDAAVLLQLTPLAANEQILVRMGMSFISTDQACSNAEAEIPTFDFEGVSQSSVSQFEEILNRIRVDSTNVTDEVLSLFYTSVSSPKELSNFETDVPHVDISPKLHGRESALGNRRALIRFILLSMGFVPIFPSVV